MTIESSRLTSGMSMDATGLPLFSTFALLTIVAGQLQGSGYTEQEPEFLSPLENLTVAQGRDVHFTCTVNRLGSYKVAWIKSDTKTILAIHTHMVTLNQRLSVTHNGHNTWMLYINNVEPKDSGTYMCQINTDPMMSQMGHLSVVIPPEITDEDGSEAVTQEGGAVELKCSANGVPTPTISWKRSAGKSIVFRDQQGTQIKAVESYSGSTLALQGVQRTDMGTYWCIAANGVPPTKSRRYDVSVQFQPVVRVVSPVVLRTVDMQVSLQCYVEASSKSLNMWLRGRTMTGGRLLNDSKYTISVEVLNEYAFRMNLTINRLKKSDFGEYSCSSSNAFGKAEGVIMLKETPQRTTTTSTTTTTTQKPTTTTSQKPTTTKLPKRHPKKPPLNPNTIDPETYKENAYNIFGVNITHNDYGQRNERQKVRPSGPPRHFIVYSRSAKLCELRILCLVSTTALLISNKHA